MTRQTAQSVPVSLFRDFRRSFSRRHKFRQAARNAAALALSYPKRLLPSSGCIAFPYYHHVFDDERRGFERQLALLRRHGQFIPFDDAVALLHLGHCIDGRYFCLSFDDGFKNCVTNALPILAARQIPCAFFIPVNYVGTCLTRFPNDMGIPACVEFLSWEDCRQLIRAGMAVGSHTCSHRMLSDLSPQDVEMEMRESKRAIERELSRPCAHFSAPFGKPHRHFDPDRDTCISRELGYQSFSTTQLGVLRRGGSPYSIPRNRIVAAWGEYQLRCFFSL